MGIHPRAPIPVFRRPAPCWAPGVSGHNQSSREAEETARMIAGRIETESTMTDRVEINAGVMQGKPVIRGTRIPVELLLRKLAEGALFEDLRSEERRVGEE